MGDTEIRPITFRVAKEFNKLHHRHNPDIQGCKFCLSCWDGEKLVGVAICGRPVSRYLDVGLTCEINRLCTDGTYNACSMLYGACCRIAKDMGLNGEFRKGKQGKISERNSTRNYGGLHWQPGYSVDSAGCSRNSNDYVRISCRSFSS